jgi:solute carrier family 25 protein 34/35
VTGRVRGALYTNPIDCLYKTWKVEGVAGWYKGTTAHFLRIFPHTVVTLVANEVGRRLNERRNARGANAQVIMNQYRKFRAPVVEKPL